MAAQAAPVVDKRNAQEMCGSVEACVETLTQRIAALEKENEMLRRMLGSNSISVSRLEESA